MKSQKTIVCALLVLACVGGLSTRCLANNGISLTITGDDEITGIGSGTYSASSKDGDVTSCSWSITEQHKGDETFTGTLASARKQGEDCYVTFYSHGYIDLKCDAQVDVKGTLENASKTKRITCTRPPQNEVPTLSIVGDDEVTINSTHLYTANYSKTQGVPTITWSYPENHTHNGNYLNLSFPNLGTLHLNCALNYTDAAGQPQDPVTDSKDIKVLPLINLTAMRANYENSNVANIPGEEIVKIHYNIDDDDESYASNKPKKGADCLQKAFKQGNIYHDDDLCKLEISLGNDINNFTEGTVHIEITKGLRLWWNNMRTKDDDIFLGKVDKDEQIALSFAVPAEKEMLRKILNYGLYVEGLAPEYGSIKIRFADKKLKLPYQCYAVGRPEDQPDPTMRKSYKKQTSFPSLVDCEWCIKAFSNTTYLDSYNCMAYAVDPCREIFNGTASYSRPFNKAFWVTEKESDLPISGFDSWAENNWRDDPFYYIVVFTSDNWENELNHEFKAKFENRNITPYQDGDIRAGYTSAFRELLEDVLRVQPGIIYLWQRVTTMKIFNRNPSTQDYITKFFTLPDFAASSYNGHTLVECNDNDDDDRIIIYYSGFHAARALSKTPNCKNLGDKADPEWKLAVSKSSTRPQLFIHRVEQISSKYGSVSKAYK